MNTTAASTFPRGFSPRLFAFLLTALLLWPAPAPAQGVPERQSDKSVAGLMSQVESARDKFEDSLDDSLKDSVIRSATGEVKVSAFLSDLKDNIKKLRERYTPGYAASAELETVLKQGNAIDAYFQATPSVTRGRSEWEQMATALRNLAKVYGATFPLATGAPVRRMNDAETAEAVGTLEESAKQFKDAIGNDKAVLKPDQDAGKKLADDLSKSAKQLKSRIADGKPANAEARAMLEQMSKLDAFAQRHQTLLSNASLSNMNIALSKIHQSFGVTPLGR